jgi:hypothetical protein
VASKKVSALGNSYFWVHQAAYAAFRLLGERLFLYLEPTYVFTSDGDKLLDGASVGKLAIRWNGRTQNAAVLRNILFWCRVLSRNTDTILINTGADPIRVRSIPALAVMNKGIEGDEVRIRALIEAPDRDLEEAAKGVEVSDTMDAGAQTQEGANA